MNNVLPSSVQLHEKYDLKGSTYQRQASRLERLKAKPTLKDLDFRLLHPSGLTVPAEAYQALVRTIERDCRVSIFPVFSRVKLQTILIQCLSERMGRSPRATVRRGGKNVGDKGAACISRLLGMTELHMHCLGCR